MLKSKFDKKRISAEKLAETIEKELSLDLMKYKNPEVAEQMADLLVFPTYAIKSLLLPVLIAIVVFLLGFYVVDLVHVQYVLYGTIGLVLFILVGIFGGILYFTSRLKTDLGEIAQYSFGIMRSSLEDVQQFGNRINPSNYKDVLAMLFQGVIHIVTIPMVGEAIKAKGGIASKFVNRMVIGVLKAIGSTVRFDEDNIDEGIPVEGNEGTQKRYQNMINASSKGVQISISKTLGLLRTPFRILFIISLSVLCIFVYLIW